MTTFWRLVYRIAERVLHYAERQLPQEPDILQRLAAVQAAWIDQRGRIR